VVQVDVRVPERVDELTDFQSALLGNHVRQQRVAGDVERNTQEQVSASLVQLARQFPFAHVELEHHMAGRKCHVVNLVYVPRRHYVSTRIGVGADRLEHVGDLVDASTVQTRPTAPLRTVHWPEIAVLVGPLVPDLDAVFLKPADVCLSAQEPQQLVDDCVVVDLLAGDEGKPLGQIKTDLSTKHAFRAGAGSISFFSAMYKHVFEEIFVLCCSQCVS